MTELAATALEASANGKGLPALRLVNVRRVPGITNAPVSNSPDQRVVARVEGWAVSNGVSLGQPVSKATLVLIAQHAQAGTDEVMAAIEHLRQEQGVTVSLTSEKRVERDVDALGDFDPISDAEDADLCLGEGLEKASTLSPETALSPGQLRLYRELQSRSVDLTQPVPGAVVDELSPLLGITPASIRSALQRVREKLGVECAPFTPPRPRTKTDAPPSEPLPPLGDLVPPLPPEVWIPTVLEPRALALALVRELLQVTCAKRPVALIEAARLLRRTLR